jgi:hypothetical protein
LLVALGYSIPETAVWPLSGPVTDETLSFVEVDPPRWATIRSVAPAVVVMLAVVQEAPLEQGAPLFVVKSVAVTGGGEVTVKALLSAVGVAELEALSV